MKHLSENLNKNSPFSFIVKFSVCFLFLGTVYQVLSSCFLHFSPLVVTKASFDVAKTLPTALVNESSISPGKSCDLFKGEWVPDPNGPYYTNNTCNSIQGHQNCMKNGRPDKGFLSWRWSPRDCVLPKFNPTRFLGFMTNKSMGFVGDSIIRNHVQSLLCTLSLVEEAVEVFHDKEYRSKIWYFPSHGFTLSVIWSPFLSKATMFEDDKGVSTGTIQLHLDELDPVWTKQFKNFDYMLIGGGKWFLKNTIYYVNNTVIGCHNCQQQERNITETGFVYAYSKVLNTTLEFITNLNNRSKTKKVCVIFRTITPDHFENGGWNNGGFCNRTRPFKEGEVDMNVVDEMMRGVEVEEFEKAAAAADIGYGKGMILKLMDITNLSLLRPDGHPGAYRQFHPFAEEKKNINAIARVQNDCLHWCLPGPIDSWNDLMLEILINC